MLVIKNPRYKVHVLHVRIALSNVPIHVAYYSNAGGGRRVTKYKTKMTTSGK